MKPIKKRYLFLFSIFLVLAIFLFFLSSMVKNWLTKNSEELIGRKLDIAELHFDYWHIAVKAKEVRLHEANRIDNFLSFSELYINFSPWKLLGNEYSFSEIRLDNLQINIEKNGDRFNFNDLIPPDDSTNVPEPEEQTKEIKFSIYNLNINNGELSFHDVPLNNKIELKKLNFNLPLIAWDNHQSNVGAEFNMGEQGKVVLKALVDQAKNSYEVDVQTTNIPLLPITNYLKDYMDVDSLNGLLTTDLIITGNMEDVINISITGQGKVTDLSVIDGASQKILSAPETRIGLKDINLKTFHFVFSNIEIDEPYLFVARDTDMTNLERFFLPYLEADTLNTEEAGPASGAGPETTYTIDTIRINNGLILFADNTLNRESTTRISKLNATIANLSQSSEHIPVNFSAELNNGGTIRGTSIMNMVNPMNIEFDGQLKRLDLVSFSPYSEFYIASPFTQGWLNYDLKIKIQDQWLTNENQIKIEELEFGKRTKDKPYVKVPIRLALYVLKDTKDNITIDMPVSGSTADPKFKVGKLIWKTFLNLIEKTALSPFNALAGLTGSNPEKLELIRFEYLQDSLKQTQNDALASISKILQKKPGIVVTFTQRTDAKAEMEQMTLKMVQNDYQAKHQSGTLPNANDPAFLAFVREQVPGADSLHLTEACLQMIPPAQIRSRFDELLEKRNQLIREYFINQGIPETSVVVSTADLRNLPEEIKRPEYKVEVSIK